MQRSRWKSLTFAFLGFAVAACADEGVGDPCIPEAIRCDDPTKPETCGYRVAESNVESSSVQCRSRLCIVHRLRNRNDTDLPTDPNVVCANDPNVQDPPNCAEEQDIDQSVYCTCKCDGPKTSIEFCECPSGYECKDVITQGPPGLRGSYCVRPDPPNQ